MTSVQAVQLINATLKSKTGKQLTRLEKEILKAAWDNEPYSNVAENLYLSIGHIKDSASLLWQYLSDAFGQKITKNNFRWVVEKLYTASTFPEEETAENNTDENFAYTGNILIVDDQIETLRFLTDLLTENGHKVRCVTNGKMALKTIRNNPPDVILLAIQMPEINGYEVCEALKSYKLTSEIPVIFLNAVDEVIDRVKAFKVGGLDYLTTPFYPEEVIARVENQLSIQQQKHQMKEKIEQHQQTAKILYQSRTLLANLLNSSPDGIVAVQAVRNTITEEINDFRCLVANPVFARLFGKKSSDFQGKSTLKKFLNKLIPTLFYSLVEVVETGETFEQEFNWENDSIQIWYYLTAVKFGDGCSITIRDITNFKLMEFKIKMFNYFE